MNPATNAPWNDIRKMYRRAREKAKLPENFWFHDTRAGFVVNARRAGVDDKTIMSMTGHKTLPAFDRYNRVDASDQMRAVERIEKMHSDSVKDAENTSDAEKAKVSGE